MQGLLGETGLGFRIAKSYISVASLGADTSPIDIEPGEFAIIEPGDVNNPENSRLYLWNGSIYSYVSDLSGEAGVRGLQGLMGLQGFIGLQGIQGIIGVQGLTGLQGLQGLNGLFAAQGIQGTSGVQGTQGSGTDAATLNGHNGQYYLNANNSINGIATLISDTTIDINLQSEVNFYLILDQDTTFTITNALQVIGKSGVIIIKQDSVGGHTVNMPTEFKTPSSESPIVQNTVADTLSAIHYFVVDENNILIKYSANYS